MSHRKKKTLQDFASIPGAIVSYILYRMFRGLMLLLVVLREREKARLPLSWKVISKDFLRRPLVVPVLMARAPRWNPHAVIARAGPLEVKGKVSVDIGAADRSARAWFIRFQPAGRRGREVTLSRNDSPAEEGWLECDLTEGKYTLSARYYGSGDDAVMPAVKIGNVLAIDSCRISVDLEDLYRDLPSRRNILYRLCNYFVFTMLRFQDVLPDAFLRRTFLPAADAATQFEFGEIFPLEDMLVEIDTALLQHYSIYYTVYDNYSFPVRWGEIDRSTVIPLSLSHRGFYLFRAVQKRDGDHMPLKGLLKVGCSTLSAESVAAR